MSANTVNVSSSIIVVSISADVSIENAVRVIFGDRPKALEDGTQGDHSVAYALYQRWLSNAIEECIASCKDGASDSAWVGMLAQKMREKFREEGYLLTNFGLAVDPSVQATLNLSFTKFLNQALELKNAYANDADIKSFIAHKNEVNSAKEVPKSFIKEEIYDANSLDEYKKIESARFENLITQRKIALGAKVAENAAVEFLKIKNASQLTSFKQVQNREADKGQGPRITGALNALSKYISGNLDSIAKKPEEEEVLPQETTTRGGRTTKPIQKLGFAPSSKHSDSDKSQTKEQLIALELAKRIITLLDFKKLNGAELQQVASHQQQMATDDKGKKLPKARFRTNDTNSLHFTIASLLATTFQAFPEIEKDEAIKKLTVKAVIAGLLSPEYAGKNNAMWDSNDISSDDVNKILALLEPSDSNNLFGAIATKQSHDANALETPPPSDDEEGGWSIVERKGRRKASAYQTPLLTPKYSLAATVQPVIQKAPPGSWARVAAAEAPQRQSNPYGGPVIFSPNLSTTPNTPPKSPPFIPPQPPKGGGPGFGGSG